MVRAPAKVYNVSKEIPLKTLVRAYELWTGGTDLTLREISRALEINLRTLQHAIVRAERKGLYGSYLPASSSKMVIECIQRHDGLTTKEIQNITGLAESPVKHAIYRAYERKIIRRRKRISTDRGYIYY